MMNDEIMSEKPIQLKVTKRAVSDHRLAANWRRWEACNKTTLALYLQKGWNGCDMSGCIEVATFLLPTVRIILVFSGDVLDNCYHAHRVGRGLKWAAKPGLNQLGVTEFKAPITRLKS